MKNIFIILAITLSIALLSGIVLFGLSTKEADKNEVETMQHVLYYNVTYNQAEQLANDSRISESMFFKSGSRTEIDNYVVLAAYVEQVETSMASIKIIEGNYPKEYNEVAVDKSFLKQLGRKAVLNDTLEITFVDGTTEELVISGFTDNGLASTLFSIYFSKEYAETGSQLKKYKYDVAAKIVDAKRLNRDKFLNLIIDIGADYGIERQFVNENNRGSHAFNIDGVKSITEFKTLNTSFQYGNYKYENDYSTIITAEDMDIINSHLESDALDYDEIVKNNQILIYGVDSAVEVFGTKFKVGDVVNLSWYDGTKYLDADYTIGGIIDDETNRKLALDSKGYPLSASNGWLIIPEGIAVKMMTEWYNFTSRLTKNHNKIPSASILPENDPSVLFTTAGMHPLVPYLLGERHPLGKRLVNVQKCLRTDDIDEVGDEFHHTYFEMLGNWSLGDYFKDESIKMSYEFLTSILMIPSDKLSVTVFGGYEDIPRDIEAYECWKNVGLNDNQIFYGGMKENWWGPAGKTGPCGPDTEIFYDTGKDSCGTECGPLCDCGRYVEIWNNVFMQYNKDSMSLERILAVYNHVSNNYETDLFKPIIEKIEEVTGVLCEEVNVRDFRIIVDHMRAAVFVIGDPKKVTPSNTEQGYIRIKKAEQLFSEITIGGCLSGELAFRLYDTFGFPIEFTVELANEKGIDVDIIGFKQKFIEHQEKSRNSAEGKFKGGLADNSELTTKLHTATHLLNAALRQVLGDDVYQRGSNITTERLRFDFSFKRKMTGDELSRVSQIVNEAISKSIPVECFEMTIDEAKDTGALGIFEQKYGETVKVYKIDGYSKEICGGPHAVNTKELGSFKIIKEESSSSGVRRIKAKMNRETNARRNYMATQEIIITNAKTAQYNNINLNKIFEPDKEHKASYEFEKCTVSSPANGNRCNVNTYSIPPKKSNYPYHYHSGVEEIFYIINGNGILETPKGERTVVEGDVIVIPSGEGGAHKLTNSSDELPLVYLDVDTRAEQDIIFYPHSNKIMAITKDFKKLYNIDTDVNYLEGE
ncbi:alanyl-trna synthetase [Holotrichia oblita]|nr:alanyl-trna synthetase [Holotrichia oblita]